VDAAVTAVDVVVTVDVAVVARVNKAFLKI